MSAKSKPKKGAAKPKHPNRVPYPGSKLMGFVQMVHENDPPPGTAVRVKGEQGTFVVIDYWHGGSRGNYAAHCRSTNNKVQGSRFFRREALKPVKAKRPKPVE